MPRLNANTIAVRPGSFEPVVLYAGDDVPDWATDLIGEHLLAAEVDTPATTRRPAKNALVEAWREYAASLELEVADDATKADIVAAVDAHDTAQQ